MCSSSCLVGLRQPCRPKPSRWTERSTSMCSSASAGLVRHGRAAEPAQHCAEDPVVDRVEQVPVHAAEVAGWVEDGRLADLGAAIVVLDVELEPEASGKLHLGCQEQSTPVVQALHPPKVDCIA